MTARITLTATCAAIALAACVLAAPAAAADPDAPVPAKARELAARGRELHDRGDYARALAAFRQAYVLAPSPGLLFNLAQAHRLRGDCDDAAILYRRYLAAGPSGDQRALAERHLASVERCARAVELRTASASSSASSSTAGPFARGRGRRADVLAGRADPLARPGARLQRLGGGALIGGGVLLSGAVYYALFASGDRRAEDRAATHATWLGLGGAAAITTGVTLVLLGQRAERAAAPLALVPVPGGAQVHLAWAF